MRTRGLSRGGAFALLAAMAFPAMAQIGSGGGAPGPIAPVQAPPGRPLPGGPPVELTLEEAVALALRDNRDIRSAYLQRVVQRFDLRVAERAFVPQGGIGVAVVRRRIAGEAGSDATISPSAVWRTPLGGEIAFSWQRIEVLDGAGRGFDGAEVSLSQPLLRGAGVAVNMAPVRIARLQEDIAKLQLRATVSGTVSGVIVSYRNLVQAQEQVRLAQESLERTRALVDTNRALIAAGRMAEADIVQTESGVANQEVALLQSRQQLVSSQLALLRILAMETRTNVVASDRIAASRIEVDLDRATETAVASRYDLLAQRKALEQMRQSLIVTQNNRLWDMSLVASASRDDGPRFLDRFHETDTTVGVRLSIPIGDLTRRQAALAAETDLSTAQLRLEELQQAVESQVLDAVQSVETSWRQAEAARRARVLSERALDLGQEKLRFGRSSNFEVLSLQADLRAAAVQELSANIGYLNALTALDQQIGSTLETWRISLND